MSEYVYYMLFSILRAHTIDKQNFTSDVYLSLSDFNVNIHVCCKILSHLDLPVCCCNPRHLFLLYYNSTKEIILKNIYITNILATKAMNTDIKRQQEEGYQPCLNVFDVIMLNDKVLTNKPLRERLAVLQTVFDEEEGRLQRSQHTEAKTK